jgi:pimeloyl-ACP methyl ester carboxylesterase
MTNAVLRLYRSAIDIGRSWGPDLDQIAVRGLCIEAGRDPYRPDGTVQRLASRTGAELLRLPESGHFWMLDAPARSAAGIREFWSSVAVD